MRFRRIWRSQTKLLRAQRLQGLLFGVTGNYRKSVQQGPYLGPAFSIDFRQMTSLNFSKPECCKIFRMIFPYLLGSPVAP